LENVQRGSFIGHKCWNIHPEPDVAHQCLHLTVLVVLIVLVESMCATTSCSSRVCLRHMSSISLIALMKSVYSLIRCTSVRQEAMRVSTWRWVLIWLWIISGLRWSVVPTKTALVNSSRQIQSAIGRSPWEELRMHLTSCCQLLGSQLALENGTGIPPGVHNATHTRRLPLPLFSHGYSTGIIPVRVYPWVFHSKL